MFIVNTSAHSKIIYFFLIFVYFMLDVTRLKFITNYFI